jgi:hypothetical protein
MVIVSTAEENTELLFTDIGLQNQRHLENRFYLTLDQRIASCPVD